MAKMEYIVYTLLLLISLCLLLKVSFFPWWGILLVASVYSLFTLSIGEWATEQSKGIVSTYLGSRHMIQGISILILFEAIIMIAFCFDSVKGNKLHKNILKLGLFLYPGFLFALVIAFSVVHTFWTLTGINFRVITYSLALIVFLFVTGGTDLLRFWIKKQVLRLELLFICCFFIIIFSVIFAGN
ncbi:MAG: hypothetical protein PHG27_02430 [Massilibacteroides sp.]|nr:hypothetical protein [Massilibacteroides sp.]MDD3062508.1 hypothetical protein [Massilibacteroides sp.]MDD4114443.1 hypothetical protein [Massilibacteroides sp.]MDD4660346.1 hypothetical protein [Massilibacteroides sp.]